MNFKKFFQTSATNPQHRSVKRITNGLDRKHQNIVARSQSPYQYKNANLDAADLNKSVYITPTQAQTIAKQYSLNIDKEDKSKSFEKQLKDSGKFLTYIPQKGYYIKTK
jgi:hypothetical protein